MDHSYGAIDDTVLKAGSAVLPPLHHNPPYIDTQLPIKPTNSSNMHLSHAPAGYYDRIKREEMASDISGMFSRAAAVQLYDKMKLAETVRYSAFGVEVRGLRSAPVVPSCVPAYNVKDFVAASNSFNFLACADVMQTGSSTDGMSCSAGVMQMGSSTTSMNGHVMHDQKGNVNGKLQMNSMMVPSSLSGYFPKGNIERQALKPNHSLSRKNRGPASTDIIANQIGFYASDDCMISTGPHLMNVPSNHLFSPDILSGYSDSPDSPNSPSKQESALSAEDLDNDWQKTQIQTSKRRKTQQKRIVCVPVGPDGKHLKGETPPSDMWAWRKYGQKPIKGSPYPRGYYRCSSSKGCSARKQVERSCTDPSMLIVTYTSDHNHDWPVSKTSTSANAQAAPTPVLSKDNDAEDQSEEVATTTTSCEVVNESLFSSIVNSANSVDGQVASSLDVSLHDKESFSLKRDVDLCFLSRTSTGEEDGVFDDLGELPEMSTIFSKGYLDDKKHVDDGWFVQ